MCHQVHQHILFFDCIYLIDFFQGDQFEGGDIYFGTMAKANRTAFSNFTCKKKKKNLN